MYPPRILDLFCGAGGAAMGYRQAGFDVVGVDNKPQPHYPFVCIQEDALDSLQDIIDGRSPEFDAIHASPPCQAYSSLRTVHHERDYPDLVAETRTLLQQTGLPYIIENVPGAPLNPTITLCGSMFGLGCWSGEEPKYRQLRRHRLFEASFPMLQPECRHEGEAIGVYGHGRWNNNKTGVPGRRGGYQGTADEKREAMQIDWMNRDEVGQAIPPAYTYYIGIQLRALIPERVA